MDGGGRGHGGSGGGFGVRGVVLELVVYEVLLRPGEQVGVRSLRAGLVV